MNRAQRLQLMALFGRLMEHPKEISAHIDLAQSHGARFSFAKAASQKTIVSATNNIGTVPLWAERATGRDVSPVDWIKIHYGNKDPLAWDSQGLTRKKLGSLDHNLYQALGTWIYRHPEDANLLATAHKPNTRKPT